MVVLQTVQQVLDLIQDNIKRGDAVLKRHAADLLGPRKRGSITEYGLEAISDKLLEHMPTCRNVREDCMAYRVHAPELKGKLCAVYLNFALDLEIPIRLREGKHGPEFFIDQEVGDITKYIDAHPDAYEFHKEMEMEGEDIYIITEVYKGEMPAVSTWHPGKPLGCIKDGINGYTAVKLHNG